MTFIYEGADSPPRLLSAKFKGAVASFLVKGKAASVFKNFRWGSIFQYAANLLWQDEILKDYTLFECYNFVWEKDINFERTQFFLIDRDTQRAVQPAPNFQKPEELDQWHAANEQRYGLDADPPVELRIDRLCLTPQFVQQNDAFVIGMGYVPRYFRGSLYVNERLKAALSALSIGELAFEATDYFEL